MFARPMAALTSFGEASRFCGKIVIKVFNAACCGSSVRRCRQAGILITGSA